MPSKWLAPPLNKESLALSNRISRRRSNKENTLLDCCESTADDDLLGGCCLWLVVEL